MKPANEIQIKRNVYAFSALVVLLSLLIGSSSWTLIGGQINQEKDRADSLQDVIDSTKSILGDREAVIRTREDSIQELASQLRNCDSKAMSQEIETIKGWLNDAGKSSSAADMKTNAGAMEFVIEASTISRGLAIQCKTSIGLLANKMEKLEKDADKAGDGPRPGAGGTALTRQDSLKIAEAMRTTLSGPLIADCSKAEQDLLNCRNQSKSNVDRLTRLTVLKDASILRLKLENSTMIMPANLNGKDKHASTHMAIEELRKIVKCIEGDCGK